MKSFSLLLALALLCHAKGISQQNSIDAQKKLVADVFEEAINKKNINYLDAHSEWVLHFFKFKNGKVTEEWSKGWEWLGGSM